MAVSILTPATATEDAAATTHNISYPTGPILAGDRLVLLLATGGATATVVTTPGGWTQDTQFAANGSTGSPSVAVYDTIATGSESGSLTVTTTSTTVSGQILAFRGTDTTLAVDVLGTNDATGTTSTPTISGTVPVDGSALVMLSAGNNLTLTATPPGGWTETADRVASSRRSWEVAYLLGASAGATGSIGPTYSGSTRYCMVLLALRPAPTAMPELVMAPRNWN